MYDDGCDEICVGLQAMHKETLFGRYLNTKIKKKERKRHETVSPLYSQRQPKRVKMTALKPRHIPPLLRAYLQLHTHSTPPLTVHGHNLYGHTCSMTPVVIFSKNAGSNEPQCHAYFPYSVGLKRVVESEGGV